MIYTNYSSLCTTVLRVAHWLAAENGVMDVERENAPTVAQRKERLVTREARSSHRVSVKVRRARADSRTPRNPTATARAP